MGTKALNTVRMESKATRIFSQLLYRTYVSFDVSHVLEHSPRLRSGARRILNVIRRYALPTTQRWVRIRSGLSDGMWIRVQLPGEGAYWRGEHEAQIQQTISAALRPGMIVYDIGAHIGTIALGVARAVGESGCVVAFEPDPDNVSNLIESVLRNRLGTRIQVVHAAVWSHCSADGISFRRGGMRRSHGGIEAGGEHPIAGNGAIITVPVVTLDDFIARGGPLPHLLKIDVEGGEYEVLCGGVELFSTHRPAIIVEVHRVQASVRIEAWLQQHKYAAKWIIPQESFPRTVVAAPSECYGTALAQESRASS